jgi:hypothetical protein
VDTLFFTVDESVTGVAVHGFGDRVVAEAGLIEKGCEEGCTRGLNVMTFPRLKDEYPEPVAIWETP